MIIGKIIPDICQKFYLGLPFFTKYRIVGFY